MAPFIWSATLFLCFLQSSIVNSLIIKRWNNFTPKHAWANPPTNWELIGPAPSDYSLQLRIGLKQDRAHELISNLYEVSDPTHPRQVLFLLRVIPFNHRMCRYGDHLSKAEVDALAAPHKDSTDFVEAWLSYHDVEPIYNDAGDWIFATVTVDKVEQMLGTKYNLYKHTVTSETIVRTMSYSLPTELHDHVNVVTPATYFGTTKAMRSTNFVSLHLHHLCTTSDLNG
jgi:tripeptidyl-peptidase I